MQVLNTSAEKKETTEKAMIQGLKIQTNIFFIKLWIIVQNPPPHDFLLLIYCLK